MAVRLVKHVFSGVEYESANKFSVKYNDVFSMKYFYKLLKEWLVDNKYAPQDDEKFGEVFYLQKEFPVGREIWVRWRFTKEPEGGSKLWLYDLRIDIHVLGLKEVEISHQNKRFKADKGEVEITANANVIVDYENAWKNHPWLKNYKTFILNKLVKGKFDFHKINLYDETVKLQEAVKTYLQLTTYLPTKELGEFKAKKTPE